MSAYDSEREAPPQLIQQNPICRLCLEEVTSTANGWTCPRCEANWSSVYGAEGCDGYWDDEDEPRCESVGRPRSLVGKDDDSGDGRCLLGESHVDSGDGHRVHHRSDGMCWGTNYWIVEVKPALTVEQRKERDAAVTA